MANLLYDIPVLSSKCNRQDFQFLLTQYCLAYLPKEHFDFQLQYHHFLFGFDIYLAVV